LIAGEWLNGERVLFKGRPTLIYVVIKSRTLNHHKVKDKDYVSGDFSFSIMQSRYGRKSLKKEVLHKSFQQNKFSGSFSKFSLQQVLASDKCHNPL
jgi:hypothetical protein